MTVSLQNLENLIKNRGSCGGPFTTFPRGEDGVVSHAEVTITCSRDTYVAFIQWLAAMVSDVPALLEVVRTEFKLRAAKLEAFAARAAWMEGPRTDAAYESMDRTGRALMTARTEHESALEKVSLL